jgi:Protein of unknown function (DUF4231)
VLDVLRSGRDPGPPRVVESGFGSVVIVGGWHGWLSSERDCVTLSGSEPIISVGGARTSGESTGAWRSCRPGKTFGLEFPGAGNPSPRSPSSRRTQQVFQFHPNWITYRATAETLRQNAFLYVARVGPYASAESRRDQLAEVVRDITAKENASWTGTMRQAAQPPTVPK